MLKVQLKRDFDLFQFKFCSNSYLVDPILASQRSRVDLSIKFTLIGFKTYCFVILAWLGINKITFAAQNRLLGESY
jgi:hypothetical protein